MCLIHKKIMEEAEEEGQREIEDFTEQEIIMLFYKVYGYNPYFTKQATSRYTVQKYIIKDIYNIITYNIS